MDQHDPDRPPPPPPGAGWAVPDQPPDPDPPTSAWTTEPETWEAAPTGPSRRSGRLVALVLGSAAVVALALGIAWVVGDSADEGDRADRDVEAAHDDPEAPADGDSEAPADGDAPQAEDGAPGTGDDAPADDQPPASDPDQPPDAPEPTDPDADLDPPDPGQFSGVDATYAQLLVDIDASERTMIGFQDAIVATLLGGSASDPEQLVAELSATAAASADRLEQIRADLEQPIDDQGADKVRDRYVEHLDTWVDYIRAIERQPRLLDPGADTDRFTLAINVSADAFSRELQAQLPAEVDAEVARFAEDILDRGFRSVAESQV